MRNSQIPSLDSLMQYDVNRRGDYEGIRQTFYDSQNYVAAGQLQQQFFQVPLGQGTTTAPGATGAKTFNDTNMQSAGQLPQPQHFLVESIEIKLYPTPFPTTADATDPPAIANFVNDIYEISKSGDLDFFIGSKSYLREGPLDRFPPKTKLDGWSSIHFNEATATDLSISNEYATVVGRPYYLDPPVLLVPNQNFNVSLNWGALVPVSAIVRVFVILDGLLYRQSQ